MKDKERTKEQLVDKLAKLHQQITELEHVKRKKINSSSHMERYFNQ